MKSSLIRAESRFDLTSPAYANIEFRLVTKLKGRVKAAYLFGSLATGRITPESDIDLLLVCETEERFVERPLRFGDLLDIFPEIDILVYTPHEFEKQMRLTAGFWGEFKRTMRRIV
jgi:predicted nucleotidyltransferase